MRHLFRSATPPHPPGWVWALPFVVFIVTAPLWLHSVEPALFIALNTFFAPVAAQVWTTLSLLGDGMGLLGVTAPLLVLAPRLMWAWLCAAPFAVMFARAGKFFIESPRPAAVVDHAHMRIVGETLLSVSMPSGHTLTAFAVAGALYFALPERTRWHHAWLWLLALGTGLSRIAVGAHWPGDVAVGASLGLLAGLLGSVLLERLPAPWCLPGSWALRAVALVLALDAAALATQEGDFVENLPLQYALSVLIVCCVAAYVRQDVKRQRAWFR